jgi:hypothetical protein
MRVIAACLALLIGGCADEEQGTSRTNSGPRESAPQAGAGRLEAEPPTVTVERRTDHAGPVPFSITLRNVGAGQLVISNVHPLCGCTQASPLEKNELAPGDEAVLRVAASVPRVGQQDTFIEITTDSPTTPLVSIPVKLIGGDVHAPYVANSTPKLIRLSGPVPGGEAQAAFVAATVEYASQSPWIQGFTSDDPRITAALAGSPTEERSVGDTVLRYYEIEVQAETPPVNEQYVGALAIVAASQGVKTVPGIEVSVHCVPAIQCYPNQILVRIDSETQFPITKTVLFRGDAGDWQVALANELPTWLLPIDPADAAADPESRTVAFQLISAVLDDPALANGRYELAVPFETTHPSGTRSEVALRIVVER